MLIPVLLEDIFVDVPPVRTLIELIREKGLNI